MVAASHAKGILILSRHCVNSILRPGVVAAPPFRHRATRFTGTKHRDHRVVRLFRQDFVAPLTSPSNTSGFARRRRDAPGAARRTVNPIQLCAIQQVPDAVVSILSPPRMLRASSRFTMDKDWSQTECPGTPPRLQLLLWADRSGTPEAATKPASLVVGDRLETGGSRGCKL